MNAQNQSYVKLWEQMTVAIANVESPNIADSPILDKATRTKAKAVLDLVLPILKERDELIRHYEITCTKYALTLRAVSEDLTANIVHQSPPDPVRARLEELLANATALVDAAIATEDERDGRQLGAEVHGKLQRLLREAESAHADDIKASVAAQARRLLSTVFQIDDKTIDKYA